MDDDEAFARMLQQQLLDEERMLMEQEQQQQMQQMQQQQMQQMQQQQMQYPPPTSHHQPHGGYSDYGHGAQYGQHQPGFDPHAYARGLQQQGIGKEHGTSTAASRGPPPHLGVPYNPNTPQYQHQGHSPQQVPYNPNIPQYQYQGALPQQAPPYNPNPSQYQAQEDPDLALARRMQEMEARGQCYQQPQDPVPPNPTYGQPPPHYNAGPPNVDRSQEEEDARLARLLAETGQSFRDLSVQGMSNQAPPAVSRPVPSLQEVRPQATTQPPSVPGPKRPPSYSEPPPSVRSSSQPQVGMYGRELPVASLPPSQVEHSINRPQELAPSRQPPPNMRPSTSGGPPSRSPIPAPPPIPRNSPGNAVHRSMDPVPLDQGPLNTVGTGTPRQHQGRGHGNSAKPVQEAVSVGLRGSDLSEPPMMPGDAFLDVPAPLKKEKQKKKGLLGMFGRTGGKDADSSSARAPAAAAATSAAPKSDKNRGIFGAKSKPIGSPYDQNASDEMKKPAANDPTNANGVEEDVVRFKIPDPVPRPADTIGAPKGPLPYSLSVSRDAPELPEATVGRRPQLSLSRGSANCAVCNQQAQNPLSALDKKFHIDCFRCITCHQLIDPAGAFAFLDTDGDKQPMHRKCYAEIFGIKCCVCKDSIPAGPDGKVSFVKHPFFDTEQMCPRHARNMTRRCTGCHRFEPENEPFADLNDVGRCVCMSCCRSVVVDSHDAQPLWGQVVEFFDQKLNMPIWKDFREVPILVVGYNALNDQMRTTQNVHGGASQIMTRGLCLTEHESGRRFQMNRMRFDKNNKNFVSSDAEERGFTFFQVPDASKSNPDASVTAILCLSGLPKDLSASVLAHEATHAWIKLHPRFDFQRPIPPQVEEGCAQLIALLFLNEGLGPPAPLENNDGTGPSDEKLRQYFKFSIETDDHEIYGTGYRRAALAYSKIGIEALMSHIVLYQDFPEV